jgi:hypothetical protein
LYAGGIATSGFSLSRQAMGTSQHGGLCVGLKAARVMVERDLGGTVADNWFDDKEYDGPFPGFANMEMDKPLRGAES